jgi:hypothetical protein
MTMRRTLACLLLLASCAKSGMGAEVRTDIAARMQSAADPITACYAETLKQNRKVRGMMVLQINAAPGTGQFTDILVTSDAPNDAGLRQCVLAAVGTLKLAVPQQTRITIDYPINFQPTK